MKTATILNNTITQVNRVNSMEETSLIQKNEVDEIAEQYANSVLNFVYRKEMYAQCCGGMYYA